MACTTKRTGMNFVAQVSVVILVITTITEAGPGRFRFPYANTGVAMYDSGLRFDRWEMSV